ncbi:MAG TPA: response regulator [Pyrinomonadaceae bacterium]|nr:response regulator [Pyrinomonadaceae bacterium]
MNSAHQLLHRIADPLLTPNERARLRCQLAKQLEEVGNYEAAREAMGERWRGVGYRPILEELDSATAAELLLRAGVLTGWIGCIKQIEGSLETAKDLITESLTIFESLQDTLKTAEVQMELGHCYWRVGAFNEARDLLKEALSRIPSESGDLKAVTLSRLATVEKVSNRLNDALHILVEAAPLFEASSNHTLKGRFYNEYGTILKDLGKAEHRVDYTDRALIAYAAASYHFEQAKHSRYQAYVENNLGFLFGSIRNFAKAHEHLDRAQALFTSLKDRAQIAQVDDTRARVFLEEGRISQAEKFSRSAVQTLKEDDQQALYAEALTTHGIALARLGNHEQARTTLRSAVEVAQGAGDTEGAGLAALTIIEDLGEHLTVDELGVLYQQAAELLANSRNMGTHARLSACASKVLFLLGTLPIPQTWKNFSLKETLRRYEARIIERALRDAGGTVTRAAHLLGFKHHTSLINRLNSRHQELLSVRTPIEPRRRSIIFINDDVVEIRPLRILHLEDNKLVADAVRETLEMEGWTVETLGEGNAALEIIQSEAHYDVLIINHEVPGLDGIEIIRQARQLTHRQQVPIIVLSGGDVEREARRVGANAFLKKPEDIAVISETIARLLARKPKLTGKGHCE